MIFRSKALLWVRTLHSIPIKGIVRSRVLFYNFAARADKTYGIFRSKTCNHYGRNHGSGFIAGRGDGIVTVGGVPAERRIFLFERERLVLIRSTWSAKDGTYLFDRLDPDREYMVMAEDYKRQYEPVVYDFVRPAVDDGE